MHAYAAERSAWGAIGLFAISVLIVALVRVAAWPTDSNVAWWVTMPSIGPMFLALRWLAERYAWNLPLLRHWGVVSFPDLSGEWSGVIRSSYGDFCTEQPVTVRVVQQWAKIGVVLETEHSRSQSIGASLLTKGLPEPILVYTYINDPNPSATPSMQSHRGTATLVLTDSMLKGEYYSGRGRQQIGDIRLHRIP